VQSTSRSAAVPDAIAGRSGPAKTQREIRPLLDESDQRSSTIMVSLLGLSTLDRDLAVATSSSTIRGSGDFPVFLTDNPDFSVFVKERYFYEYFPPVEDQIKYAKGRRWDLYVAQRIRVVLAKWRPKRIISPGMTVQAFIRTIAAAHNAQTEPLQLAPDDSRH
jgi:hypothetical protein